MRRDTATPPRIRQPKCNKMRPGAFRVMIVFNLILIVRSRAGFILKRKPRCRLAQAGNVVV